jgi:putative nucleotidyltransferase with HDIG domain
MHDFWRHSLYCALIARILAKKAKRCDPDAVFTAALLHDIGELVIFNRMPLPAKEAILLVLDSGDELPVYQAEQEIIGFDHAQVGGELARQWKLPPMLEECVEFHHNIRGEMRYPREVTLVHIANILALMAEVHTLDPNDVPPVDSVAWEMVGLKPEDVINQAISEAEEEISEAEELFLGK